MLRYINLPDNVLPSVAPYCHAVRAGEFLFVTGQLVLNHSGSGFDKVVMARIFVTDFRFYQAVNDIYKSYFSPDRLPGRTTVGVTALAEFGDVEIDLIAYCGEE